MNEKHIVALSGGKDSTVLALLLQEREPREYEWGLSPRRGGRDRIAACLGTIGCGHSGKRFRTPYLTFEESHAAHSLGRRLGKSSPIPSRPSSSCGFLVETN